MKKQLLGLICIAIFSFCNISLSYADIDDPYLKSVERVFGAVQQKAKQTPQSLENFTAKMPKGGDIHNHFAGAILPEVLFNYARYDLNKPGWCLQGKPPYEITLNKQCLAAGHIPIEKVDVNSALYKDIIRTWSLRDFKFSKFHYGHDHFFLFFYNTPALTYYVPYYPSMLADLMRQAYKEHILYLEFIIEPDTAMGDYSASGFADRYLDHVPANPTADDINAAIATLVKKGFDEKVVTNNIINPVKTMLAGTNKLLGCDSSEPQSACQVQVRFQYGAMRPVPLNENIANTYAAFKAIADAPNIFVGVNLVAAEDDPTAMKDYDIQMKVMKQLQEQFEKKYKHPFHISLHAGELSATLVKPAQLGNHIYKALTEGNAERIGHGIDVLSEEAAGNPVFKYMNEHNNLVEENLTSNEKLLGVCDGPDYCISPQTSKQDKQVVQIDKGYFYHHPFYAYVKHNVPVALGTDDQGLLITDLNHEYFLAAKRYPISYQQLKDIDRNSLSYAFIKGNQLWLTAANGRPDYQRLVKACVDDNPYYNDKMSQSCRDYLNRNLKAKLQWTLEKSFADFESKYE